MSDEYTLVQLAWRKRRRNHRILFGAPVRQVRLDWQRSFAVFKPGDIFGYERWEANKYGTQHWSISILQAGRRGEDLTVCNGVRPGAIRLLNRSGKDACKALLFLFDQLRLDGPLERLRPIDWQVFSHRIEGGSSPKIVKHDMDARL